MFFKSEKNVKYVLSNTGMLYARNSSFSAFSAVTQFRPSAYTKKAARWLH